MLEKTDAGEIEVVGEAVDGEEAVAQAGVLQPDVLLIDLGMPVLDGVEASRRILEAPPATALARALLNGLADVDERFLLVLDDYHLVRGPAVHELVGHLLKHPPLSLHLVILTRHDPPLPLTSLRARHRMNELRLKELQFDERETYAFLGNALPLSLDAAACKRLHDSTEGWPVGLRLAVPALRQGNDVDELVRGFDAGSRERGAPSPGERLVRGEGARRRSPHPRARSRRHGRRGAAGGREGRRGVEPPALASSRTRTLAGLLSRRGRRDGAPVAPPESPVLGLSLPLRRSVEARREGRAPGGRAASRVGRGATLVLGAVGWVRLLPLELRSADARARQQAVAEAAKALRQEGREADAAAAEELAADPAVRARAEVLAEAFREPMTFVAPDGRRHVYPGGYDSYTWLRFARNLLEHGRACDEVVAGECRDALTIAPWGTEAIYARSLYVPAIAGFHRLLSLFDPQIPLPDALRRALGDRGAAPPFGGWDTRPWPRPWPPACSPSPRRASPWRSATCR